jgi:hypothetical protein
MWVATSAAEREELPAGVHAAVLSAATGTAARRWPPGLVQHSMKTSLVQDTYAEDKATPAPRHYAGDLRSP